MKIVNCLSNFQYHGATVKVPHLKVKAVELEDMGGRLYSFNPPFAIISPIFVKPYYPTVSR